MASDNTIKGKVAVTGIGESAYYKRGRAPVAEFELTLDAILAASADAGIDPKDIDGFVSFHDDRATPPRLVDALGVKELRWSTLQWGGGGGGGSGAIQQAAAAVAAGFAETVVVYRGLAQGQTARYGSAETGGLNNLPAGGHLGPYGFLTPAIKDGIKVMRFYHETGLTPDVQKAVSLATYHHAQRNPRAVMYGRPLTSEKYDESRWIVEPFRLFDLTQETEGACALIVTTAERARDLRPTPAYVVAAAQGGGHRSGTHMEGAFDGPKFATTEYEPIAKRLWEYAGLGPKDVDVVQSYDNFSGLVPMALIEHGFFTPEEAAEQLTFENLIVPDGSFPINTSGANLAEAYVHGLELAVEAVRQIRGESVNQVKDVNVSFVNSGPGVIPGSSIIFGTEAVAA